MAKPDLSAVVAAFSEKYRLGRSHAHGAFGVLHGMPVHLFPSNADGEPLILFIGTAGEEACEDALEKLTGGGTSTAGLTPQFEGDGVILIAKYAKKLFKKGNPDVMAAAIAESIEHAASLPGVRSAAAAGARAGLVNSVPGFLTDKEIAELREHGESLERAYSLHDPNYPLALLFGLAAMVGGALIWATIAAFLKRQVWIVAIGAGALIGVATLRGAGKGTPLLKLLIFALTLGSVVLGEVLSVAFLLVRETDAPFDLIAAAHIYFDNLRGFMDDFLFAVGGGLIGGFWAMRFASKPHLQPSIEVAP